jgi:hypothetical protein
VELIFKSILVIINKKVYLNNAKRSSAYTTNC